MNDFRFSGLTAVLALCCMTVFCDVAKSQITQVTSEPQRPALILQNVDAAQFYQMRTQAIAYAKQGEWHRAKLILEPLTKQHHNDGDLWFILGHSYLQTQDWSKAITALTQAIELGTILTGVDGLSHPANDIMVEIAKAHNQLNNTPETLHWLNKALAARWDDRPSLINHDDFNNLAKDEGYQKVSGSFQPEGLSRHQMWQFDLAYFASEIERLHVAPFHHLSKDEFTAQIKAIHRKIPKLNDQQITYELMTILGKLGNSHNILVPTYAKKGNFKKLPVTLYQFSDGLFIVDASSEYQQWVGYKVEKFGTTDAQQALQLTKSINARDNEMQTLWLGPHLLTMTTVLKELGIVADPDTIELTLSQAVGGSVKVNISGDAFEFREMPPLPANKGKVVPDYLADRNLRFWMQELPQSNALYVQFNLVANSQEESLKDFSQRIQTQVSSPDIEHLILDLRHNNGGNGALLPPLLRSLIHFETTHPDGKLFVIFGRKTFSAAQLLLTQISQYTNAIMVGEPSGSRPNHIGESGWFRLPFSGLRGVISSQFHQASKAEDHRIWIPPHIPVSLSSDAYFSGEDPSLEAVNEIIRGLSSD